MKQAPVIDIRDCSDCGTCLELCWSFLTPILNACETCGDRSETLLFYESRTLGAQAVEELNRTRMNDSAMRSSWFQRL
jgi:formate hydrogenlyase subunit 6/NADH:ubiquinone oxidoreductase subunit I